ncbi:MAG: aminopeptidase, partial [Elusimicrobia bacterium]|nr:aminopeptidase [Elusimicrobiota bacterium]
MSRRPRLLPALALVLLSACSPVYVARSAAGHAGLLWRRRPIAKTVADPSTPPELKAKLESALEIREFAFKRMALRRSHAYETWTPVKGPALTWLVSASDRVRFKPHLFRFPLIGAFPYKGHFRRDLAESEAASLEKKGYDSTVSGAAAYKTPLPVADPLPSNLLAEDDGDLAETLIHELTHGTVYYKNRTDFDEALATWAGARGAEAFLTEKYGAASPQMKEWRDGASMEARREKMYADLRDKLTALYDGPGSDAEKLEKRRGVFDWARAEAKSRGL